MKKGLVYILLTALIFTTLEPVSKLIAAQVDPFAITFLRFFVGGLILLPFSFMAIKKKNIRMNAKDIGILSALGVLCICISMPLLQYAVRQAESPALIAIVFSANSVFTILLSTVFLKEKITLMKIFAILLCFAGVLICTDFSSGNHLSSILLALAAALTFSLYTVLSKKFMTKITGIIQTGFSFLIGSAVLLVGLLFMNIPILASVNGDTIFHLLYLGIVVTGIGYWSYFRAMDKASAMAASLVFFIKPILTPFATFFFNDIRPDIKVFAALILVLAGSYLATAANGNRLFGKKASK